MTNGGRIVVEPVNEDAPLLLGSVGVQDHAPLRGWHDRIHEPVDENQRARELLDRSGVVPDVWDQADRYPKSGWYV